MADVSTIIREGRLLVAFCNGSEDHPQFMGEPMGYYDQPVYIIRGADGNERTWAATLTREATPEEAISYWRDRARSAEGKSCGDSGKAPMVEGSLMGDSRLVVVWNGMDRPTVTITGWRFIGLFRGKGDYLRAMGQWLLEQGRRDADRFEFNSADLAGDGNG